MPISNYGVLVGSLIDKLDSPSASKHNPESKPHFQVLVDAEGVKYRIAINVRSEMNPPNLQVYFNDHYHHPILEGFSKLSSGFHPLESHPGFQALDFIRENLFSFEDMKIIPSIGSTSGNDLNEILNVHLDQAQRTTGAIIYAFGSKWGPELNKPDPYFGFIPGNGIHDIHMNQGNIGHYSMDNGVYQDGALFIYYPDENRYMALFAKFQSQEIHSDDKTAQPRIYQKNGKPEESEPVRIFAALIKPPNGDIGNEKVYMVNLGTKEIKLDGWSIIDRNQNKDDLTGKILEPEGVLVYTLSGKGAQLSNKGGIITLLNDKGLKISGVSYTQYQIPEPGNLLLF